MVEPVSYQLMSIEVKKGSFDDILDDNKTTCVTFGGQKKRPLFFLYFEKDIEVAVVQLAWKAKHMHSYALSDIYALYAEKYSRHSVICRSANAPIVSGSYRYEGHKCPAGFSNGLIVNMPEEADEPTYTVELCDIMVTKYV